MANGLSKPNQSVITSLLLPKVIKNWSTLHERGGGIIYASPCSHHSHQTPHKSINQFHLGALLWKRKN